MTPDRRRSCGFGCAVAPARVASRSARVVCRARRPWRNAGAKTKEKSLAYPTRLLIKARIRRLFASVCDNRQRGAECRRSRGAVLTRFVRSFETFRARFAVAPIFARCTMRPTRKTFRVIRALASELRAQAF
ncbi:MAG TPA: hypothetical protein VF556_11240 [Pyrinomonadaceae bacterium]